MCHKCQHPLNQILLSQERTPHCPAGGLVRGAPPPTLRTSRRLPNRWSGGGNSAPLCCNQPPLARFAAAVAAAYGVVGAGGAGGDGVWGLVVWSDNSRCRTAPIRESKPVVQVVLVGDGGGGGGGGAACDGSPLQEGQVARTQFSKPLMCKYLDEYYYNDSLISMFIIYSMAYIILYCTAL